MEGLGPWAVMRGATFDCGLAVVAEVAALPAADVLLAALLLLGEELQPATPMAIAATAIVIPVLASVRFIALAPVGGLYNAFAINALASIPSTHRRRRGPVPAAQ